jgi:hypothetical protein
MPNLQSRLGIFGSIQAFLSSNSYFSSLRNTHCYSIIAMDFFSFYIWSNNNTTTTTTKPLFSFEKGGFFVRIVSVVLRT